jgi:hypothetical protein
MADEFAFPIDPQATGIAVAYQNTAASLIQEQVCPRSAVPSKLFSWVEYDDPYQAFRVPQTRVGPRGRVPELEFTASQRTGLAEDHGLRIPLSWDDLNTPGRSEKDKRGVRDRAAGLLTSVLQLRLEVAIADLYFSLSSYPTAQRETLAGVDQLNNGSYVGDPLKLIHDGLDACLVRPNTIIFGQPSWSVYRSLAAVVSASLGNDGTKGFASRERLKEIFEVENILVGSSWVNTAKPGEATARTRAWGKHISMCYIDPSANHLGGVSFGSTFEFRVGGNSRIAGFIPDRNIGALGGEYAQVAEFVVPKVIASHAGYHIHDAVA